MKSFQLTLFDYKQQGYWYKELVTFYYIPELNNYCIQYVNTPGSITYLTISQFKYYIKKI
jgi:hypothetical protein